MYLFILLHVMVNFSMHLREYSLYESEIKLSESEDAIMLSVFTLHSQLTTPHFVVFFKTMVKTNRGFHDPLKY